MRSPALHNPRHHHGLPPRKRAAAPCLVIIKDIEQHAANGNGFFDWPIILRRRHEFSGKLTSSQVRPAPALPFPDAPGKHPFLFFRHVDVLLQRLLVAGVLHEDRRLDDVGHISQQHAVTLTVLGSYRSELHQRSGLQLCLELISLRLMVIKRTGLSTMIRLTYH